MSAQHTQGLLHVGGDGTIIYDDQGWGVANATVFHGRQQPETSSENARRLVACWNACDALPIELIEQGGFAAVPVETHRDVKAQRDELLAALKGLVEHGTDSPEHQAAEVAIAKAEGGAV